MSAILTKKYSAFLAKAFISSIGVTLEAYTFLGRPQPWSDSANNAVNDLNPPPPTDTVLTTDFEYWKDIIGLKRATSANTAYVVPRRNWVSGTVYAQYDDTNPDLYSLPFYALDTSTTPYRVYKCLWNNKGGQSTIAPSTIGSAVNPVLTADNYVWQYMYQIQASDYRFLTNAWMPVLSDSTVQDNALAFAGRLPTAVPLVVVDGGSSYNAAVVTVTTIKGDGAGATVTSNGVSITSGIVTSVLLANGGSGYTVVTSVNVFQTGAVAANVRALIPPYPNHGYDPIEELGVSHVMMHTLFTGDESGKLSTVQDFRRNGLIINPLLANGEIANASFYKQTYDIGFTANTGVLSPDDEVVNISKAALPSAVVVDVTGTNPNYTLRLTGVNVAGEATPFVVGDVIKNLTTGVEITVASVTVPEIKPYSGSLIFVNHRTPVTRGADETEEIKIIFPLG